VLAELNFEIPSLKINSSSIKKLKAGDFEAPFSSKSIGIF
jgi:hypothetical protein